MTNEEQMVMMDEAWKDVEAHAIEGNPYLFAKSFNQAVKQREAYEHIVKQKAMLNELERQQLRNRHYKSLKHEPIDVMRDWLSKEQFIGFCLGNALKYLSRYNAEGAKGGVMNIDKAIDYLEWIQEATTGC